MKARVVETKKTFGMSKLVMDWSGLIGLWAAWYSGWYPWSREKCWTWMIFKVPPSPTHSMITWSHKSKTVLKNCYSALENISQAFLRWSYCSCIKHSGDLLWNVMYKEENIFIFRINRGMGNIFNNSKMDKFGWNRAIKNWIDL